MPDDFKTIIILRDIQELSYDDISKIVELPLGTVKSRIRLAMNGVRKDFGEIVRAETTTL